MVITHWPVLRSHCRIVLSEAPVTCGREVSRGEPMRESRWVGSGAGEKEEGDEQSNNKMSHEDKPMKRTLRTPDTRLLQVGQGSSDTCRRKDGKNDSTRPGCISREPMDISTLASA